MIARIPKRLVLLALILFLAVGTGHSTTLVVQKKISVSRALAGHVLVLGTDEPVSGVTFELCSSDWKTVLTSTTTDEKGYFSLARPATEKLFYIRVSALGMDIYELRVRIKKHAAQELTIHLSVATWRHIVTMQAEFIYDCTQQQARLCALRLSLFTGKERDAESGNDYFGARYFGSSMGRFMTPDWSAKPQGVPYAVLDDPQSLNLYAYVRNNPLSRTDPSGHYICTGNKAQCQAVADGLAQARAALAAKNADGSPTLTKAQHDALQKVVGTFGKAGDDHDGVTVSFGKTQSPRASADAHSYKDENGLLRTDITFNSKTFGSLNTTEVGGELVHERSHGLDGIARGNMDPQNKNQEFRTELRAYGVESYVPKALNVPYPGLWNPNWAPDSADASRFTGVLSGAITSTSEWCREGGPGC